ncbi:uncharacterized protein K02A2.6-like [Sycon ciliatum]|uniref:uncharacterized protein K02A2.6-like n=1 Tax=Sycon ciliatum TaxID=27933 RepID=UPI0031F67631
MARFNPPAPFDFSSPDQWPAWKLRFTRFRAATKLSSDPGETQVATLLYALGPNADSLFEYQLGLSEDDKKKYDEVVSAFDTYFRPSTNVVHERAKFEQLVQQPGQTVEEFVRALYKAAEYCEFAGTKDERIRDRFVAHMLDKRVSRELQMKDKSEQTLAKVVAFARHAETVQQQVAAQSRSGLAAASSISDDDASASAVQSHRGGRSMPKSRPHGSYKSAATPPATESKCPNCGGSHHSQRDQCPARGQCCKACGKRNHFARVCRSKPSTSAVTNDSPDSLFVGHTTCAQSVSDSPWLADLAIGKSVVQFKLDTGADVSTMSVQSYNTLQPKPSLSATSAQLRGANDQTMQVLGVFEAHCSFQSQSTTIPIFVLDGASTSLLSRSACTALGLVQRLAEVQGPVPLVQCMVGPAAQIHLTSDATPYHCLTARRVPHHLYSKVREELHRMEDGDIIARVDEPTDWCSPMVPVLKPNGKVRICVDLKRLNASVKRETFQLPTLEDALSSLAGATVFTTLDTANGFWQVPLSPDSARLTTFITPFGRFYFKRLPFGITSAPEIFQKRLTNLLDQLPGVFVYMDDIIVSGRTREEHDRNLAAVLDILQKANVTLNMTKCHKRQAEVKFLGHIFSAKGLHSDPARVSSVANLKPPKNVTELKRILGMFAFMSRFIPNLSEVSAPLRLLLGHDTAWEWSATQQQALDKLKQLATNAPCLTFFDSTKPTVISADASSYGLGAVLLQEHDDGMRPIAFASRSLTTTEQQYAQIEKECLAVVWACERFHGYIYGNSSLTVQTDHKPLIPLINTRDLNRVPMRCQRLLMRLLTYNPAAVYVPGKELVVADALSRAPLACDDTPSLQDEISINLASYIGEIVSDGKARDIADATTQDKTLKQVLHFVQHGWPCNPRDVDDTVRPYFHERQLLSCEQGVLCHGFRIVMPPSLQPEMLEKLHEGHQGATKCKSRARHSIWWPGLSRQIDTMVATCEVCTKHRVQSTEPLQPVQRPTLPWHTVGADLMEFNGTTYLVIVDYLSRYLDVVPLTATTSIAVIKHLHRICAEHGFPSTLVTDNGPQFASEALTEFCTANDITHRTSSPRYPQSNGEAERAVRTAKNLLRKAESLQDAPLAYRTTPLSNGYAPCQLLYGRQLRTGLPATTEQLEPKWPDLPSILESETQSQEQQKLHYDQRHAAKPLATLQLHDRVFITDLEREGKIVEQVSNRSYLVESGHSTVLRNRRHLIRLPLLEAEKPTVEVEYGGTAADPVRHSARAPQPVNRLIESC